MSAQNIHELIPFNNACDEFISGKYILADIKINSILNIISNDEKISNIVASCIDNYDFNTAFANAQREYENDSSLVLPTDERQVIAFVYN